MKQILYVSDLVSDRLFNELLRTTGVKSGYAIQKFNRLTAQGLAMNGCKVVALTYSPLLGRGSKAMAARRNDETENGIRFRYIPRLKIPVLCHIVAMVYTFLYVVAWGHGQKESKAVVCDALKISASIGAMMGCKLAGIACTGIVTDVFGLILGNNGLFNRIAARVNNAYMHRFDRYVLLTRQMNALVNPRNAPHIIMEAICDISQADAKAEKATKAKPRTLLYAGSLFEEYGVGMLTQAFIKAHVEDARLVFYGDGPYVAQLKELCQKHSEIDYRGIATNNTVVREEQRASVLVNPRLTNEEYTKYSFPSKNAEYMASGTPLLTTRLPGMPREYEPYVLLLDDESVDGYAQTIKNVFARNAAELESLGAAAREFILRNKNNKRQAARIIELIFATKASSN